MTTISINKDVLTEKQTNSILSYTKSFWNFIHDHEEVFGYSVYDDLDLFDFIYSLGVKARHVKWNY